MVKKIRLTLDLKVHIKDELDGKSSWKQLEHTRRFLEKMKQDDSALLEFYKIRFNDELINIFEPKDVAAHFKVKSEFEIIQPLLPQLPTETAEFITNVFSNRDEMDGHTRDENMDLIYNQFDAPVIVGIKLNEIDPGDND